MKVGQIYADSKYLCYVASEEAIVYNKSVLWYFKMALIAFPKFLIYRRPTPLVSDIFVEV